MPRILKGGNEVMFIGREKEMKFLNERYEREGFDFIPIYGRRRVGKTELIVEFLKDKKAIIYSAVEQSDNLSLVAMSEIVLDYFGNSGSGMSFNSWDAVFEYISTNIQEKIVLVIDEYPYLCKSNMSISSILQKHMDHSFKEKNIMIILCGSSMSFMENQVLGYSSPLYGRRTGQIKVLPFTYYDAVKFLPKASCEEKVLFYSVADGIPQYLKYLSEYKSLDKALIENFFTTSGHLFEEPSSLLKQELREPANYFSVISAIAAGKTRLNEIATKSGIENTTCSKYLKILLDLRIIERDVPISEKPQKNGVYKIADNCFRFWFRYVVKNMTAIEFGRGEKIWELIKIEDLSNYLGKTFEDICKQYIMLNYTESIISKIGGWWGNNPLEKKQEEIDILAISSGGEAIFGECKWRNELLGEDVLKNLQRKANLFPQYDKKTFYLFSKSGFTYRLKELVELEGNIILVGIEDLFA